MMRSCQVTDVHHLLSIVHDHFQTHEEYIDNSPLVPLQIFLKMKTNSFKLHLLFSKRYERLKTKTKARFLLKLRHILVNIDGHFSL